MLYKYSKPTKKSAPQGIPHPLTPTFFQHGRGIPRSVKNNSPVVDRDLQPALGAPKHSVHFGRTQNLVLSPCPVVPLTPLGMSKLNTGALLSLAQSIRSQTVSRS